MIKNLRTLALLLMFSIHSGMAEESQPTGANAQTTDGEAMVPQIVAARKAAVPDPDRFAVGSVAPEIVGVDETGTQFRLSDYKGKVVLLDFWGFW